MKKVLLFVAALAAITTVQASQTFVEYAQTIEHPSETMIYKIQPLSELVGNGGTRHELTIGKKYNENFLYGIELSTVPETHEYETSMKIKVQTNNPSGLNAFFGTKVGMGMQTGSKEKKLSTNVTKLDYTTSSSLNQYKTPSTAILQENPLFLHLAAQIGVSYEVFKNVDIFAAFEIQQKYWQLDYRIAGKENVQNLMTETQRLNNISVGLNYKF